MRKPAWARNESPEPVEVYLSKLREDVSKSRLRWRGVERLPLDHQQAAVELTEEQRALRGSRPRNRRWRQLNEIDEEIDELQQKLADARTRLQEAEAALVAAPQLDAERLAAWIRAGEKGEDPAASLPERQRERDARQVVVNALELEVDKALDRRHDHITRHRKKMIKEAQKDVDAARSRLLEQASVLPALRDTLVAARETLVWVATYPGLPEAFGNPHNVALGLAAPLKRSLNTTSLLDYAALLAALEEDANALAEAFAEPVKQALGTAKPADPTKAAKWWDDPNDTDLIEWKKQQLEHARRLAGWGHSSDQLANEIREDRP
jgi:DNA repair exonuclease SbcCD ATPase subunit